jgi:hypothetical protein
VAAAFGPQIVTNFYKLICADVCRFEDCFFDRINRIYKIGLGAGYIL